MYLLGHEELQATAQAYFRGQRLAGYQDRLHAWAQEYRDRGWPGGTPEYLLSGYFQMLTATGDTARLAACATDAATDGSEVSPPGKSGSWPPSSTSPPGSSRHGARTAAASRRPGSPAKHAEPRSTATAHRDRDCRRDRKCPRDAAELSRPLESSGAAVRARGRSLIQQTHSSRNSAQQAASCPRARLSSSRSTAHFAAAALERPLRGRRPGRKYRP